MDQQLGFAMLPLDLLQLLAGEGEDAFVVGGIGSVPETGLAADGRVQPPDLVEGLVHSLDRPRVVPGEHDETADLALVR